MSEHGMAAIVLEPGTSMRYFVDVARGTSERPFLLVIPARGELAYVAPGFEEARPHLRPCSPWQLAQLAITSP